jgi:hypothetical protein
VTPSGPRTKATAAQLQSIAQTASVQADLYTDADYRVSFLAALELLDWSKTDARWRSAMELLRFDRTDVEGDPINHELGSLLVQIAAQADDMASCRGEYADREDLHKMARELRDATDRLCRIVYAVTAVHTLGSAAA